MVEGHTPILLTITEPGPQVTDEELNSWYDGKHMDDFLPLSFVKSGTRLVQSEDSELDANKPRYAALYDITDVNFPSSDEYKAFISRRTDKDHDLVARVFKHGYFNRRTYLPLDRGGKEYAVHEEFGKSKKTIEGGLMVLVGMTQPDSSVEDFHGFYEKEHLAALQKVPGWLRSRRYVRNSHEEWGALKEKLGNPDPPMFLIINEYESTDALRSKEYEEALSTPWKDRVVEGAMKHGKFERFIMKVHKDFKAPA